MYLTEVWNGAKKTIPNFHKIVPLQTIIILNSACFIHGLLVYQIESSLLHLGHENNTIILPFINPILQSLSKGIFH